MTKGKERQEMSNTIRQITKRKHEPETVRERPQRKEGKEEGKEQDKKDESERTRVKQGQRDMSRRRGMKGREKMKWYRQTDDSEGSVDQGHCNIGTVKKSGPGQEKVYI